MYTLICYDSFDVPIGLFRFSEKDYKVFQAWYFNMKGDSDGSI